MTGARRPLAVDDLEAMARSRGVTLPRERLAAVLEEVERLQAHVARLRTLPLDDPPWMPFVAE